MSNHYEKFDPPSSNTKIFKFWTTRLSGIHPNWHPWFLSHKSRPDIFNRSNFEYSAFSGLKVDSIEKSKKSMKKDAKPEK